MSGDGRELRLAEVLAALSLATDLGMGQPAGHAARTCLLAMRLARGLGATDAELASTFYVSLLRYIGCTADAHELARYVGDEIGLAVRVAPFVMGEPAEDAAAVGVPGAEQAKAASMAAHCEAAEMLAARLRLGDGVCAGLRHGFERWDGAGHPVGLAAEQVPLPTRVAIVARDVDVWHRRGGVEAVLDVLRARRGRAYDPTVVDAVLDDADAITAVPAEVTWQDVLDAEPSTVTVPAHRLDTVLETIADFADLKIPAALGHSREVAALAEGAAGELGLDREAATRLRHAALLHDLGRTGVSNAIWDKPGRLSADEWERVRLHAYLTERVLGRVPPLRHLAQLAGAHHERLDGSGYHRSCGAAALGVEERVLAAADAYSAMRQQRAHRPALPPSELTGELGREVELGRLDGRTVAAVAAAAGHAFTSLPARWPAGLTDREVDVLRLACRGMSRQQVAAQLFISAKTVSRHLENSYTKMAVSTRAGAALYAVHHGILTGNDREWGDRPTRT